MTNDPDIRAAKSIVDYIFRWMGKKFLTVDQQEEIGIRGRGASPASGGLSQRRGRATIDQSPGGDGTARADGAVQRVRGRAGVRQVRRADGADRILLHLQGLRD
jgi:hypothetical protein